MTNKLQHTSVTPKDLTFRLLEKITNNFSEENKVGSGGYGNVYKGVLDGEEIAVKKLHPMPGLDDGQFEKEFNNLMRVQHRNIVRLVGYRYQTRHNYVYKDNGEYETRHRALCFEYLQGGSLDKHLDDESCGLDWHICYKIIKGVCEGLNYLHNGSEIPITHMDLKPGNILLDKNMMPKIADFGLSRLLASTRTCTTKKNKGTPYIDKRQISPKFDIFSLGVIILQIMAGRMGHSKSTEMSSQQFIELVHENWKKRLQETMSSYTSLEVVKTCIKIALRCVEAELAKRPTITEIVDELNKIDTARMSLVDQKYASKKKASSPSPSVAAAIPEEQIEEQEGGSDQDRVIEENVTPTPMPPSPPPVVEKEPVYDISRLPLDPGERQSIANYPINDQDAVRRSYIINGPFQPYAHEFESRKFGNRDRQFNPIWFYKYPWIEYSIKKEAAFCFVCYLFAKEKTKKSAFVEGGWRNWNRNDALDLHVGGVTSAHNAAQERYNLFMTPHGAIDDKIVKVDNEERRLYKIRLTYSLRCLKFLLQQGLAFRRHDESEESSNRGNFIELLKWLAANNEEVDKFVLKNAPGNCTLTSPDIQKEIIQCCAMETRDQIIKEIGEDHYTILADESSDVSHKEQLALCLRYVDKSGRPCERFLGIVHVDDTTFSSLKEAIQSLLVSHGLTITQIRGQGYDGASNMKGEIKGLKTLIMKESPSAYYVHCFAHQLQLILVAVAKGNNDCVWFFDQVSLLLNIVGVSCKHHGMLRHHQYDNVMKALECGILESGSGLNQEMGLPRPGETQWGSHYKTVVNMIAMYPTIRDVLIALGEDTSQRGEWPKIHTMVGVLESFDFIFSAHLMLEILGHTNELSECLQRRDQDILNAMSLVSLAKSKMQQMRSKGWVSFLQRVTIFCKKHGIQVPAMQHNYVLYGRSARFAQNQTNDDHFRREVYIGVIDKISQELDSRFDEVNMELLTCMAALNPADSFASFDANKVHRLAEFYPNDFSSSDLLRLDLQLETFIDDMRKDEMFKGLNNLVDLSVKLVETKRDKVYHWVYLLIKLVLLLPVATASVERIFSAMTFIKNKLRNKMGDSLLDDCLVTFIERDIFLQLSEEAIINTFMAIRRRRPDKKKK